VKGPKPVIGLAGGIASGKSTIARIFESLGAGLIDSDAMNHEVLQREDVRLEIQSWWGQDTYDGQGACQRGRLAKIIFDDPDQRRKLEQLVHPLIEDLRVQTMEQYNRDERIGAIVIDSPLLFEANLDALCDVIVFSDVDNATRIDRACRSRGWSQEELRRRENIQISLDTKRQRSDYLLGNNSDIHSLRLQVERIYRSITNPM
jgi:dephospho-CoA kinase